jgi:hypothetical protein
VGLHLRHLEKLPFSRLGDDCLFRACVRSSGRA